MLLRSCFACVVYKPSDFSTSAPRILDDHPHLASKSSEYLVFANLCDWVALLSSVMHHFRVKESMGLNGLGGSSERGGGCWRRTELHWSTERPSRSSSSTKAAPGPLLVPLYCVPLSPLLLVTLFSSGKNAAGSGRIRPAVCAAGTAVGNPVGFSCAQRKACAENAQHLHVKEIVDNKRYWK